LDNLISFVNLEFKKIVEYFRSNKIALHPSKTKYMIFSSNTNINNTDINIFCNFNNQNENIPELIFPIDRVKAQDDIPAIKFLGVFFDPNLNFKFHILKLKNKLSKALYAMRMVKKFLTKKALLSVYYSLFHSHLIYAIQIWSCANLSLLNDIFKMQKTAVRLIVNARYNAHTEPIFKNLEILPFPKLTTFFKLKFMQNFHQKKLPVLLENTWHLNLERTIGENAMQLRNQDQINMPFVRLSSTEKHPLVQFPKLWDEFPDNNIKIIRNKKDFDSKLKKYLLNELSFNVNCNRLFCPSCSNLNPNVNRDSD